MNSQDGMLLGQKLVKIAHIGGENLLSDPTQ